MIPPEHLKIYSKKTKGGAEKAGQWNMGRSSPIGLKKEVGESGVCHHTCRNSLSLFFRPENRRNAEAKRKRE